VTVATGFGVTDTFDLGVVLVFAVSLGAGFGVFFGVGLGVGRGVGLGVFTGKEVFFSLNAGETNTFTELVLGLTAA